ncbi:unnamed protein product [Dicrocoelium dendriticum]|nr:unnamed protein product [Dicrocoelium dendriticum]
MKCSAPHVKLTRTVIVEENDCEQRNSKVITVKSGVPRVCETREFHTWMKDCTESREESTEKSHIFPDGDKVTKKDGDKVECSYFDRSETHHTTHSKNDL